MSERQGTATGEDSTGAANETKIRLRVAIADGYALVKGLSTAVSLAQATPEQMMQERILDLEGPSNNPRRPSRLDQVKTTRDQLRAVIEQVKAMNPEDLAIQEASDSVSSALTEEGSEEPT